MLDILVRDVSDGGGRGPWRALPQHEELSEVRAALDAGRLESRLVCRWRRRARLPAAWWLLGGYRCAQLGTGFWTSVRAALGLIVRWLLPFVVVSGLFAGLGRGDRVVLHWLVLLSIFVGGVVAHEVGHIVVFHVVTRGRGRSMLVAHGVSMHSARPALLRWQELLVVCGGPAAPSALLPFVALMQPGPVLWWTCVAVAVSHIVCLVAPVGDGGNLRALLARHG